MSEQIVEIVIDSRESRSLVHKTLCAHPSVSVQIKELSCGDYLPHEKMAIERKSAVDFVASIMDGRIFSQVKRLKDEFEQVVFMLEGNPYATRSAIKPEAVMGCISFLIAIEGVSVLMVKDAEESAKTILTLARHMQHGLGYVPTLRVAKPKNILDLASYVIEGLPGIGSGNARALIAHFGSPIKVFNASVEDLCKVKGIGQKTAERIREVLDANLN